MARTTLKSKCTKCGKVLPVGEFYKDKSQKSGHSPWCKGCEKAYNRAYYRGLKAAKVERVADIPVKNTRAKKAFAEAMRSERVKRSSATPKAGGRQAATSRVVKVTKATPAKAKAMVAAGRKAKKA